ncbi:MAG: glycosyltransferase [Candidatus Daviesbacteria bacterium]|nr:glycosyltransferase [Candidatus Daviesbacteria bacterium]
MSVDRLSVFFPAYNEEKNIQLTVESAVRVLKTLDLKAWEIIIVDDGSTDNTASVSDDLAQKYPQVRVIHQKNGGYGKALRAGFKAAKYDWIVYTDSDGQFDFSEINKFLEKTDSADVVYGYRIKRMDPLQRILFAKGWASSLFLFFGLWLKDVDCGFKLVSKNALQKILPLLSTRGGMINAEIAIKTKKAGLKLAQVGVHHYPRGAGKPTGANIKVILISYYNLLQLRWTLLDKKEFLAILIILSLASFLRFYKIDQYMTFLGDEGRDALVIKKILVEHDFPLLGPPTSIGNIYLGPLYYYMMAIPMALFWLNPIAAAYQVAIIGVLTVLLVYFLAKEWFGNQAAIVSSLLYAISPVNIIYSRSSWNPNPAPFFALLTIFSLYKMNQTGNFLWLILTGIAAAFVVQMHYLALVLIPIVGVLWFHQIWYSKSKKIKLKYPVKGTILGLLIFLFLMSPLVIFDFKYNFLNSKAITVFFTNRESTVNLNPLNSLSRTVPIYKDNLVGRYLAVGNSYLSLLLSILILIPLVYFLKERWQKKVLYWPYLALGVWLFVSLIGLALYKQNIYDHYLGFLNPVPYLLLGAFTSLVLMLENQWSNVLKLVTLLLILLVTILNFQINPTFTTPQNQLQRTKDVSRYIIGRADGKPFNFALLSKNNYDAAYQFYLDLYGYKPKQIPFEITDQLFVVCEDQICEPIGHAKQEISHFGWAKIENESSFKGVKIFKLIHNPSGKPPEQKGTNK